MKGHINDRVFPVLLVPAIRVCDGCVFMVAASDSNAPCGGLLPRLPACRANIFIEDSEEGKRDYVQARLSAASGRDPAPGE